MGPPWQGEEWRPSRRRKPEGSTAADDAPGQQPGRASLEGWAQGRSRPWWTLVPGQRGAQHPPDSRPEAQVGLDLQVWAPPCLCTRKDRSQGRWQRWAR